MQNSLFLSFIITFLLTLTTYWGITPTAAQVMQSGSYQIQSDSINVGGGFSSSTNYVQESTAGEIATGESSSGNFSLKAGYQQMASAYIALSGANNVTMLPTIGGVSGGVANGSTTITVTTDSTAGYQLTIESLNDPAMQGLLDTIADYVPAGAAPDFTFNYGASDAYFGYSPEGADVAQRFLDNGTDTCNTDSNETTGRCWDGLSTTAVVIAEGSSANHPTGATTTVAFRLGIGGSVGKAVGTYIATTTVTALAL